MSSTPGSQIKTHNDRVVIRQLKKSNEENKSRNDTKQKHQAKINAYNLSFLAANDSSESSFSVSSMPSRTNRTIKTFLAPASSKSRLLLVISHRVLHDIKKSVWFLPFRYVTVTLAFVAILILADEFAKNNGSFAASERFNDLHIVVNVMFLLEGMIKSLGLYAYIKKIIVDTKTINQSNLFQIIRKSGADDILISILCLIYMGTSLAAWLALLRVVYKTTSALQKLPLIGVIMVSGF